jgi:ubiquinone/menaquinone biosynthesis C-methylase UbiE
MEGETTLHDRTVVEQFSKQATPFSRWKPEDGEMERLVRLCGITRQDDVLDIACGPGLVACAVAPHARHVTGIDLTPRTIEIAKRRQRELSLTNVVWQVGNVLALPFDDGSFTAVITRYSFHHFLAPADVLAEMHRVCKPGGRVMVVDVTLPPDKADAYDRMEKRRDPSHARVLTPAALDALVRDSGLVGIRVVTYDILMDLERLMRSSFPDPADAIEVRRMFHADVGVEGMGLGVRLDGEDVVFSYPVTALVGRKPK